jgi:hypothetical protein
MPSDLPVDYGHGPIVYGWLVEQTPRDRQKSVFVVLPELEKENGGRRESAAETAPRGYHSGDFPAPAVRGDPFGATAAITAWKVLGVSRDVDGNN